MLLHFLAIGEYMQIYANICDMWNLKNHLGSVGLLTRWV